MIKALAAMALLASAVPAAAVTITFDGASNNEYDNTTITRSGYVFGNPVGEEQHFHELDSATYGWVSNGTSALIEDRDTEIFMVAADSSLFTLSSFDIAEGPAGSAISYAVSGYLNGSLVGTLTGNFNGSFQTIDGSSLGALDRVVFDGIGSNGFFQVDNITVNAASVPEPASWAMMVGGFGLLGGALRRKKAQTSFA